MSKLKEFYRKNRVYSILMIISTMCIILILVGVIMYFLNQTKKDVYGSRLEGIESVKLEDSYLKDIEDKIGENEKVNSVEINLKGKLIYININLKTGTHADTEAICQESLSLFKEEEKSFYDIQYIINNDDSAIEENFPIMGYIKSGSAAITWTHYVQE